MFFFVPLRLHFAPLRETVSPSVKTELDAILFPQEYLSSTRSLYRRKSFYEGVKEMNNLINWLLNPPTDGPRATLIIRLMAGSVFFWEGVMKFVFPNQGLGRFTKLGFPFPHFTATADGWFEIIGGLLLLGGWLTRVIAIPFIIEMIVAMASTKIPMFLGTSPLPLPPVPPQIGFWAVLHEIRSEYAQLACCAFLLFTGPGVWSIDALWTRRRSNVEELPGEGLGSVVPVR